MKRELRHTLNSAQQILLHRVDVAARTVKHFGLGGVNVVLSRAGVEYQIVKDDRVNYRFGSIDELEAFTDKMLLTEEKRRRKPLCLRLRKAALILNRQANDMGSDSYMLSSRMNNQYEEKKMLQLGAHHGAHVLDCAKKVRRGRQGDTSAGVRTRKSNGRNMGADAVIAVAPAHAKRHRAAAVV